MNFTLKNRLRFLPETVIVSIIAVPLILTEKSTHFMYNHTCRMGNGSGSRRRLLNSVQAALKSPFSKSIHTAIPPPAVLCDIKKCLLLFLNGFSLWVYFNILKWFCQHVFYFLFLFLFSGVDSCYNYIDYFKTKEGFTPEWRIQQCTNLQMTAWLALMK